MLRTTTLLFLLLFALSNTVSALVPAETAGTRGKTIQVPHDSLARQQQIIADQQKVIANQELAIRQHNGERESTWIIATLFAFMLLTTIGFLYQRMRFLILHWQHQREINERELRLQQAILESQESERRELAGVLHDHISALFATVNLYLSQFRGRLGTLTDDQEHLFEETMSVIHQTSDEVKMLSKSLTSAVLERFGLVAATDDLCQHHLTPAAIDYRIWPMGFDCRLDLRLETSLYRMLNELLANVAHHSSARCVNVRFHTENGSLQLVVEDDGSGFITLPPADFTGGLKTVHNQIRYLKGELHIDSRQGIGTSVTLEIPETLMPAANKTQRA